jgi:hypothetical protein
MNEIVISLCDFSTKMVQPWATAGYECICVDIQHPKTTKEKYGKGVIIKSHFDIINWEPPTNPVKILFAFPPCDHLAVSGARWFKDKGLKSLIEGLTLVERCREIAEDYLYCPYMIENPVSTLSSYWRKPDYSFNPCDYGGYLNPIGDEYTKKTCLWVGNGFKMPNFKPVKSVLGSKMHLMPPSEERKNKRSETPSGFAQAVFEYNH